LVSAGFDCASGSYLFISGSSRTGEMKTKKIVNGTDAAQNQSHQRRGERRSTRNSSITGK